MKARIWYPDTKKWPQPMISKIVEVYEIRGKNLIHSVNEEEKTYHVSGNFELIEEEKEEV